MYLKTDPAWGFRESVSMEIAKIVQVWNSSLTQSKNTLDTGYQKKGFPMRHLDLPNASNFFEATP